MLLVLFGLFPELILNHFEHQYAFFSGDILVRDIAGCDVISNEAGVAFANFELIVMEKLS